MKRFFMVCPITLAKKEIGYLARKEKELNYTVERLRICLYEITFGETYLKRIYRKAYLFLSPKNLTEYRKITLRLNDLYEYLIRIDFSLYDYAFDLNLRKNIATIVADVARMQNIIFINGLLKSNACKKVGISRSAMEFGKNCCSVIRYATELYIRGLS